MKPKAESTTEEEQEKQQERAALSRRVFKSNQIRASISRYLNDMAPAKETAVESAPREVGIADQSDMHDRYAARIKAKRRINKKK